MSGRLHGLERSRSRLLADLGHEMRTPLATLEAYLEAYLEALEDGVATLDASTASLRCDPRPGGWPDCPRTSAPSPGRGGAGRAGPARGATFVSGDGSGRLGRWGIQRQGSSSAQADPPEL